MNFNMTTENAVERAFKFVTEHLYCPDTKLLYDHRFDPMAILPTPEEISRAFPNPCGYGTGMEDSVINGAGLVDALLTRVQQSENSDELILLHNLVEGLCLTAEAGTDGFLPRSRTPLDGKSHYPDSSRDQYTLFLYAMHRFLLSGKATDDERGRIRKAITGIADRAVRNVTEENDFDLLREDGGHTFCSQMWGKQLGNHEVPRLPIIYLSAWRVSGEESYLERYRAIRSEAFSRLLPMADYWHVYCAAQMQMALAVIADLDPDDGWREKYYTAMQKVAEYCVSKIPKVTATLQRKPDFRGEFISFRDAELEPRKYPSECDLPNLAPVRPGFDIFYDFQDAANILFAVSVADARDLVPQAFALMSETLTAIDFDEHVTGAPVQFLQAYYAWRRHFSI